MNRVRIVKKDYQKLLRGLPQDHPPHNHNLENRYDPVADDHSPDEHRTICYTTGVYREKLGGQQVQPSGKQLFKKHVLQNERLFGQEIDAGIQKQLKHYRRNIDDSKRIKTLQRSIELYNHTEQRSDKLKRKDVRALSNPRREPKFSPYVKKLNRQSLNVSRDRTKTNIQSSSKVMRLPHDEIERSPLKLGTMSEMKIVDRRNLRLREDELLERGKTCYQENKFAQAVELFSHLLAKNPRHLQGNYLMAVSLMGRSEFARALRYFDQVIDVDPAYNRNVFILYAICCKKLSQGEQAVDKLSSCISMFPEYYDAYIYRGKLKLKEKKLAEAITDFIHANELSPEKPHGFIGLGDCFYSMKDDQKAYDMFSKAVKLDESLLQSPICLKMVSCLSSLMRAEQAISLITDYLKTHPNSAEGLLHKGNLLSAQKKYNEAVMAYDQLIKLNDRKYNTKALELMIKARICQRDFYSAYHLIERIQFLDVDKPALDRIKLFAEAVLNLMKRKFSEAVEMFEGMAHKFPFLASQKDASPEDDMEYFLKPLFHLYGAYGYFCLSDYEHARNEYSKYEAVLTSRNKSHKILESSIYNKTVCEALLKCEAKLFGEAIQKLVQASATYPNKVEPYIYQGIIHVQISTSKKEEEQPELLLSLQMFSKGIEVMGDVSNNTIANVFYHRAVVYSYLGIWNEAINDIDRAIEKSQDNIPKYFYLRGLAFACCQSFKQAIHDLSVCLTLNENYAEAFLMRSKCLQIEGQANQAFVDLQRYITLKPEDPFIHKYAGHLLFENGAFEDSILAYAHGEALPDRDVDIFLTRGKAYFLLGEFSKAYDDLLKVTTFQKNEQNEVDLLTIKVLSEMKDVAPKCYDTAVEQMTHILKERTCEGRIFKQKEFHMIRGGAFLFSGRYKEALLEFNQCMTLREGASNKLYSQDDEQQDADQAEQVSAYLNHMRFNAALCYIMMSDFSRAKDMCNKCTIQKEKTTLQLLLCAIRYELGQPVENDEREATIEVRELEIFSLKNKLSRHLIAINPRFKLNPQLVIRPCFSFPKVEPPEITPEFDKQILLSLDPSHIENKPQAPWIRRADNSCIMFTSNIQVFDNLDLETEQKTKRNEQEQEPARDYSATNLDNEFYKSDLNVSEDMSPKNIQKVKQKLKLEGDIEKKLNKLIKRQHS